MAGKEQMICDLTTAAVVSIIGEQTGMGGMCQVQWELEVKWVMYSPAILAYVCGMRAEVPGLTRVVDEMCTPWCRTSGRLFEVP